MRTIFTNNRAGKGIESGYVSGGGEILHTMSFGCSLIAVEELYAAGLRTEYIGMRNCADCVVGYALQHGEMKSVSRELVDSSWSSR